MSDEIDWYSPEMATFGDRLAAAREEGGMTQQELARRLGVRLVTLQHWEDDQSEPRANRLSMLAGLLNVSMMWLINGEGEGLADPEEGAAVPEDVAGILAEVRVLKANMQKNVEKLGRLEKRLRLTTARKSNG